MNTSYYQDEYVTLHHGDCIDVMRTMPDSSVDAIVTDPPYGLGFMGKKWDDLPPGLPWAAECLRVLKPGGHLLAFGGSRTWHRLAAAVEDAGFEMRDSIAWLYGQGFPKSHDVSKAIDKAAGAEREVVGSDRNYGRSKLADGKTAFGDYAGEWDITAPPTPDAEQWQGWGTALKPAFEPVVVGRKPLVGTVAANVLAHGAGALNIDACRIPGERVTTSNGSRNAIYGDLSGNAGDAWESNPGGRWPTNVVLDDTQAAELGDKAKFFPTFLYEAKAPRKERPTYYRPTCECEDAWPTHTPSTARATSATTAPASSSTSKSGSATTGDPSPTGTRSTTSTATRSTTTPTTSSPSPLPITSASTPGARSATVTGGSRAESAVSSSQLGQPTGTSAAKGGRSTAGAARVTSHGWSATSVCGECGAPTRREAHATVKPLGLMRWLVRLVTPPGGTVLEPFAGSGTTAEACVVEGFRCIAVEREADYLPLITQRLTKTSALTPGFTHPADTD